MPAWHRRVLFAALVIGGIGAVGRVRQFAGMGTPPPPRTAVIAPQGGAPMAPPTTPQSNFASDAPTNGTTAGPTVNDSTAADAPQQSWYLSPKFLSLGGSVVGGFVIGWLMRMFVKTTLLIGVTVGALMSGLSYFHWMNIDFSSVQQQYSSDMSWVTQQATILKNVAIGYLPVHAGGLFGMFMGFRRPRM